MLSSFSFTKSRASEGDAAQRTLCPRIGQNRAHELPDDFFIFNDQNRFVVLRPGGHRCRFLRLLDRRGFTREMQNEFASRGQARFPRGCRRRFASRSRKPWPDPGRFPSPVLSW